jgi:transcriptional regulator with XRE-family HTH domain
MEVLLLDRPIAGASWWRRYRAAITCRVIAAAPDSQENSTMSRTTADLVVPARTGFGAMLREWRRLRGASQLELALTCGLSQKHLSFLESGRSRPSRGMVLHLASALRVPLAQQNALLLAAGFAPAFRSREPQAPEMQPVERALAHVLAQQEPFPAIVVDDIYDIRRTNRATGALLAWLLGAAPPANALPNAIELVLRPDGLRPHLENWSEVALWLVRRLRAQALHEGAHGRTRELLARVLALPDVAEVARVPMQEPEPGPTLVLRLRKDDVRLGLFSMIATFGTPLDPTLQDLRLEFFFPVDQASERWFRARAAAAPA